MKTLLYITITPRNEIDLVGNMLGRDLVNKFLGLNPEYQLDEFNISEDYIPSIKSEYLNEYLKLISTENNQDILEQDKKAIDRIIELSMQFKNANAYVICISEYDTNFSQRFRTYIDCIFIGNSKINYQKGKKMIYLQVAGGRNCFIIKRRKSLIMNYYKHIFKKVGIYYFMPILVDGITKYKNKPNRYLMTAYRKVAYGIESLK